MPGVVQFAAAAPELTGMASPAMTMVTPPTAINLCAALHENLIIIAPLSWLSATAAIAGPRGFGY